MTYRKTYRRKLDLSIISDIKAGLTLTQIAIKHNVSKQAVSWFIKPYKASRAIVKRGYGVWDVDENKLSKVIRYSSKVTAKPDSIRGHAFKFILHLPAIPNWMHRVGFLQKKNIIYKQLGFYNSIQSIILNNYKIWLTNRNIVIHYPKHRSYFTKTAQESYQLALYDLYQVINKLERLFKVSFRKGRGYSFSVSRNHYSLIKNALAKDYNSRKEKLYISDDNGLWMFIDDSFNLNEAEFVHIKTAIPDSEFVKRYFNDLKNNPSYLPSDIKYVIDNMLASMQMMDANVKKHLEVLTNLGIGIDELRNAVKELSSKRKEKEYFKQK